MRSEFIGSYLKSRIDKNNKSSFKYRAAKYGPRNNRKLQLEDGNKKGCPNTDNMSKSL